jgi:hypothetical protein
LRFGDLTFVYNGYSNVGEMNPSSGDNIEESEVSEDNTTRENAVKTTTMFTVDNSQRKIKNFSGSGKLAPGEVDYVHWRRAAVRIVEDEELNENRKRSILLQSVTGKAEDEIDLFRELSTKKLVEMMDKLYGTTTDAHELLANFYQIIQASNQTASEYLSLLYREVCEIVTAKGTSKQEMTTLLLRQFIRGTSDEEMVDKLSLEKHLDNGTSPSFPDLVCDMRKVEARRQEKKLRLKKSVRVQAVTVSNENSESRAEDKKKDEELVALRRRVAELEIEKTDVQILAQRVQELEQKKKTFFCYRCGIDGHMATTCKNEPNPELVDERMDRRRPKKQGNWRPLPHWANASNNRN